MRCVCAKAQCTSGTFRYLAIHMDETRPTTCPGVSEDARVRPCPAAKEKGGSAVRGTEASDRTESLAPAATEVRARAVLLGSGGAEHQASGSIPQPTDNTGPAGHRVVEPETRKPATASSQMKAVLWRHFPRKTPSNWGIENVYPSRESRS
jgi:hypothetical protein